jgi:hypothetical protein
MDPVSSTAHDRAIIAQFTQQACLFSEAPELHGDEVLRLVVEAARPQRNDRAIDLACSTGSVACALAAHAAYVVGLDATEAMWARRAPLPKAGSFQMLPGNPAAFTPRLIQRDRSASSLAALLFIISMIRQELLRKCSVWRRQAGGLCSAMDWPPTIR